MQSVSKRKKLKLTFRLKLEQEAFSKDPKKFLANYSNEKLWEYFVSRKGTKEGELAREILIFRYKKWAESVASIYYSTKIPDGSVNTEEDLKSAAILGLIEAIDRYRIDLNDNFYGFAYLRVYGAIIDQLRILQHLPRNIASKKREYSKVISDLKSQGINPTHDEICLKYGLHLNDTLIFTSVYHTDIARENESEDCTGVYLSDIPDKPKVSKKTRLESSRNFEKFLEEFFPKDSKEYFVMWAYYLLRLTNDKIAHILECSVSSVVMVRQKCEAKIREEYPTCSSLRARIS